MVIDCEEIRKGKKMPSRKFRNEFGHTLLSIEERYPWKYYRLAIGTGASYRLPVMREVKSDVQRPSPRVGCCTD